MPIFHVIFEEGNQIESIIIKRHTAYKRSKQAQFASDKKKYRS